MHRFLLACKAFFGILFNREVFERIERTLESQPTPEAPESAPPVEKPPARSEALTLLEALQREARFIDFVKEPIDGYSDAQIGAAVREIHRECAGLLDRMFALEPVVAESEGAEVDVPPGFDAGRYRLTGKVVGEPPYHGRLVHHGWEARKSELPTWSGSEDSAPVIAPAEVEVE